MIGGFLVMGSLGMIVGIGLALASKIFYVYVDPKIEAVEEALPGANCGGCGLPGCSSNAEAIVAGKASPSSCVAGDSELAAQIAEIMGVKLTAKEPDIARPGCSYGVFDADLKYIYRGIDDCRAAVLLNGGSKVCPVGCLGLGSCVKACLFGALTIGPDKLPVVDQSKCTGCGACERVCPKHIITLSSNSRSILHEYTTDQCTAPCQRACPAGVDIPAYINQINEHNFSEAVRIIKKTNPFPAICGRICVHPCEYECRRNLVDEPVAINHLKRFASDYERNSGAWTQAPRAPETENRIAVVGGGVEGLTAAYLLNRLGHNTTVYEGSSQLGGILRIGLPENRLPRDVIDWEINGILDAGVTAMKNKKLGQNISIASLLKDGFSSVFIATGGWDAIMRDKRQNNELTQPLPGVQILLDFMLAHKEDRPVPTGDNVMIIGGGNSALAAARICLHNKGTKSVSIVIRSTPEKTTFTPEEIKKAEEEGIRFYFKNAVTKMIGVGNQLTHVEITIANQNGGGGNKKELLPVDSLFIGAGRFPELIYVRQKQDEMEENEVESESSIAWETLIPYAGPFATQDTGIFRPGEIISDYKAVVEAIGSGRRAANSIQRFLTDTPVQTPDNLFRVYSHIINLKKIEHVETISRQRLPELSPQEQSSDPSAEISLGFSETQAIKEAERCLQCGLICYRRVKKENLH